MDDKGNANRFLGFAKLYEKARPSVPEQACDILVNYLPQPPDTVVDIGCGTGLSTVVWKGRSRQVIGVEPNEDMLSIAKSKAGRGVSFIKAFSDHTFLPNHIADIVVCSQSFHWMEPQSTLLEVNRILKPDGIFATIDCDWPPVCNWVAEKEYSELSRKVSDIENGDIKIKNTFKRWDKNKHLMHIEHSGYFRYCREIVFANQENCDAERFCAIAFSQGGLQTILKTQPEQIKGAVSTFEKNIKNIWGDQKVPIIFCYRMRIGIK